MKKYFSEFEPSNQALRLEKQILSVKSSKLIEEFHINVHHEQSKFQIETSKKVATQSTGVAN